jgi:hypothetical protein
MEGATMERLEQIMGEIANYAPPKQCHDWENRIRAIMQEEKRDTIFYTREGVYEYLYQTGTLQRPY